MLKLFSSVISRKLSLRCIGESMSHTDCLYGDYWKSWRAKAETLPVTKANGSRNAMQTSTRARGTSSQMFSAEFHPYLLRRFVATGSIPASEIVWDTSSLRAKPRTTWYSLLRDTTKTELDTNHPMNVNTVRSNRTLPQKRLRILDLCRIP